MMRIPVVMVLVLVACHDPAAEPPKKPAGPLATAGSGSPPRCAAPDCLADRCEHGDLAACSPGARQLAASALRSDRQRTVHLHEIACTRDSAEGCAAFARDLASGKYVPHDVVRAAALRTALCNRGAAESCYELGLQYLAGEGVDKDEAHGELLLALACGARSAEACEHLAGSEHPDMFARAFEPYLAACRAGDATSCRSAHRMAAYGRLPSDVPREDWEATSRTVLALCTAGDAAACATLATLSEPRVGDREGGRDDPAASQEYRTRACELGDAASCAVLADRRVATPYGRQPDFSAAGALFERGCQLGNATACVRASGFIEDLAAGRALLLRGCELADQNACEKAIELLRMGTGGAKDMAGMRRLQSQLCDQGSGRHCLTQAYEARERGDLAAARLLYLRACTDQGELVGCRAYAGVLRDACRARDMTSCQELDRFLAALPPEQRALAAFECCLDRPEIAASPTAQLAVFAAAVLGLDASAVRAFLPSGGLRIHTHMTWKRGEEDHRFRVHGKSLNVDALQTALDIYAKIEAVECPETFERDRATCTIQQDNFRGTYDLRRDSKRVYVVEIDEDN